MPTTHHIPLLSNFFSLEVQGSKHQTDITFKLLTETVRTSGLPHTHSLLEILLPGLCQHKCYNDDNLPFSEELRNTEIGHLFEHIILEYLYQIKKENFKAGCPIHKGETSWNWIEEEKGVFHITINIGYEETDIFTEALNKGINLMKILFSIERNHLFQEI